MTNPLQLRLCIILVKKHELLNIYGVGLLVHELPKELMVMVLDTGLQTPPFRIQTRWQVLTGSACTGKTTLIQLLAEEGYTVVYETARLYIDKELAKGRTIEVWWTQVIALISCNVAGHSSKSIPPWLNSTCAVSWTLIGTEA